MSSALIRRRQVALAALGAAGLIAGLATAGPATAAPATADGGTATYLVQLADAPVASYTGGVPGHARTKPATGAKLDIAAPAVAAYRGYLRQRQDGVLKQAAGARKLYDYSVAFNGFSARMTAADAAKLAGATGVVAVVKDERRAVDTTRTTEFLGLTKRGGLWEQLGGPGARGAGSGVVVGIVDSGAWPESPSLTPLTNPQAAQGFTGTCQTGEQWPAALCTNKIVGARYYTAGVTAGVGDIKTAFPDEYLSARDADSHGTHTATTAVGNHGVDVVVDGAALGKASGMAPNARLSVYKVCWGGSAGGCYTTDSVKAIEDATADGVDVINFSISGSTTSFVDPVERAFLGAADAGVFVAASAGNSGPGASTVAHNSPWVTTVAASTLDRTGAASVTLGNGATYTGVGVGAAVPSSPLMLSTDAAAAGASATDARLCAPNSLDPAKATGKILLCDRGVVARPDKSKEVKRAGGVGMVLANTAPSSLNADLHFVPTVHVDETAGAAIKAYLAGTAAPTASLAKGAVQFGVKAPQVASFSSRGPARAGGGDLLKPDITAPGVDVLAGTSPAGNNGRLYDYLSGTSMSSPHMAGLAALVIQKYSNWSPMRVKSALMTTATQRDNTGGPITNDSGTVATALDYGSGHVNPNAATDPGLTYDSEFADWVRFLCGVGQLSPTGSSCSTYGRIDPSDLNTPNVSIGALAGSQTVTRTVTNVADKAADYTATVQAPAGVTTTVTPSRLKLAPGAKGTFRVTFTRTTAAFDKYAFGSLTWADGTHQVRSQLAVRPVAAAVPAEVTGTGTAGSTAVQVTSGFAGTMTASVAGLVPAERLTTTLSPTGPSFETTAPAVSPRAAKLAVTIPAGTNVARLSNFDRDFTAGTDVDLYLYRAGTSTLVGSSGGVTSEEQIQLTNPAAGTYDLYVVLFGAAEGETSVQTPTFVWALGTAAAGNLTATPAGQAVQAGQTATVTAAWSGLTAGQRYLGRIGIGDGAVSAGGTFVRVDA